LTEEGNITTPPTIDGYRVTSIEEDAFYNCKILTESKFLGDAPTMSTGVFDNCTSGFRVYYLAENA